MWPPELQIKASGETVPEVHGVDKELDPHITPEQQYVSKDQRQ